MNDGQYRILAVDDNELNLGLFRLFLSQLGHIVTSANNPIDAIEIAQNKNFDLIFTDIQMPELNGMEAAARFRQNGYSGPIIAITAHLSDVEQSNIAQSDIDDVLIKPVSKTELVRILNQWLAPVTENPDLASVYEVRTKVPEYPVQNPSTGEVYNLPMALSRANGSKELANDLFHLLIENVIESKLAMEQPLEVSQLRAILHKLSGGIKFSGALRLETELEEFHDRLHQQPDAVPNKQPFLNCMNELIEWAETTPKPFP